MTRTFVADRYGAQRRVLAANLPLRDGTIVLLITVLLLTGMGVAILNGWWSATRFLAQIGLVVTSMSVMSWRRRTARIGALNAELGAKSPIPIRGLDVLFGTNHPILVVSARDPINPREAGAIWRNQPTSLDEHTLSIPVPTATRRINHVTEIQVVETATIRRLIADFLPTHRQNPLVFEFRS